MARVGPPPFKADLHIHTCLSPCAGWEMTPNKIIQRARDEGLDIIAVCDHNSSKNAPSVMALGKKEGITVLPGLEICTREEVHLLAILDSPKQATAIQEIVYQGLTQNNTPEIFGYQVIADSRDLVLGEEEKLLIQACHLNVKEAVDLIHCLGGMAIASHIDRPSYSILSQLGFIPTDLGLDGIEVTVRTFTHKQEQHFLDKTTIPCIVSSDAHCLEEIGQGATLFEITHPTVRAMISALEMGHTHHLLRGV
ncbi:MAG: PHP domain-containing protein [Desulfobacterium sp.]|nr:PHP domain-containing protein [Desulfobacterium sp.]